ncbi:hypothetical protein CWR48_11440 [Oceanobacillus arenosus]|uniref:DUF3888 domain-containing protein n=1 Tax=Oceanobacillus arenosus TaxID=1229153 RepID=A0A3D8PQ18_9BACI|nr:DUF3888 domain-containing protein [Oceanobacillus arenosus]RDW18193.1 hypothetical protein CWR48_11440 [Oceanobacillus arenosus]
MKKLAAILMAGLFLFVTNPVVYAKTINEADTELTETLKYALISSLRKPVNKAVSEIYRGDKNAPDGLTWAAYDTDIMEIKQVFGVGGLYKIKLKVHPYYGAHNMDGEDEVVVNTDGKLLSYRHLKTYTKH